MIGDAAGISWGNSVISKVPVMINRATIPTNMNAEPRNVYIRNFIAEYSRLPLPHIEIRKNIGTNSISHRIKKRRKSRAVKTPITEVCKMSIQIKYSLTRWFIPHEANIATIPSTPVRSTRGVLMPSTPRKYWTLKDPTEIQSGNLSMSWTPPFAVSYLKNMNSPRASSVRPIAPAKYLTAVGFVISVAINNDPARGKNTIAVKRPVNSVSKIYLTSNTIAKITMTPTEAVMPYP